MKSTGPGASGADPDMNQTREVADSLLRTSAVRFKPRLTDPLGGAQLTPTLTTCAH